MRAVNLIPADQRRSASAAGRSGGAVYGLLALLAVLVVAAAAYAITARQVSDREARAARLEAQAQAAQARAGALGSYKQFNALAVQRSQSVRALAATRLDWGRTLDQVSRVLPADVALTKLAASVTPGSGASGGVSLRSALQNPALEMIGCAPSQARVALLMARLRRLDGVQRVSLASSDKSDDGSAASAGASDSAGASATDGSCTRGSDQIPEFSLVVFFGVPTATASAPAARPGSPAAAVQTLNGATTTTPAPAASGS